MTILEILKTYEKKFKLKHRNILESKKFERDKIIKGRWCESLFNKKLLKNIGG